MKISTVLLRQHIGWHFSKNWVVQGRRKPIGTGVEKVLKERNVQVFKPEDILKKKKSFEK